MSNTNINHTELTRREQYYGSKKLTQEVRKLDERYEQSEDVRLSIIAAVCWEIGTLPCGANFTDMSTDERIAFIKGNESLYLANFDDLIDLLTASIAEGDTESQKRKWAINGLKRTLGILAPLPGQAPETRPAIRLTGVDVLDGILIKIEPVDWERHCTDDHPSSREVYIVQSIVRILETATEAGCPIVYKDGATYCYTGTHYRAINKSELRMGLINAACRCGVPYNIAKNRFFIKNLTEQFDIDTELQGNITEPDIAFINLRNGTLFFDKGGYRFEQHTSKHFIRYSYQIDEDSGESLDVSIEESPKDDPPAPRCPYCVHFRPETYPTQGLCAKEYCQQNLRCQDYEIAADKFPGCQKCTHYEPETYSTKGICGKGKSQQDKPCKEYEPAKTEPPPLF